MRNSIVVTGTNGFIGSSLVKSLTEYRVIKIEEDFLDHKDWVLQLESILRVESPVGFFHVGACSDTLQTDVNYMLRVNYHFTKVASDLCKKFDIPFIYSSSASIYGDGNQNPGNLYAWSKYIGENYVLKNNQLSLRYFNVYGPGEEHKGRMASVAYQMFIKHTSGVHIKIFPKKPKRDFVYVIDVVAANIHAFLEYERLTGRSYDVGAGEARTFEDVMSLFNIPFSYTEETDIPPGYQYFTCSDSNKWLPGWKPFFTLEKGLQHYLNYLKDESLD